MELEICLHCGSPTGRAGIGEDSIYAGDTGPFCPDCRDNFGEILGERIDSQYRKIIKLEAKNKRLKEALKPLVKAKALIGVRSMVAGWNGQGSPDGPYDRHPSKLGATLPKTNCGAVYELDEALMDAAAALGEKP